MNKLTIKERVGLPETNSSSSHSIVINEIKEKVDISPYLEDDILIIPDCLGYDFGNTSFEASNNVIKKIVFVIALYSTRLWGYDSPIKISKFLSYLRGIIKSFTGVKDVIFESVDKYNDYLKSSPLDHADYEDFSDVDNEFRCVSFGTVDHQSCDISDELFQNSDTLKDFIFSENSWLFLGSDCYCMEDKITEFFDKYYKDNDDYKNTNINSDYAVIDFGYNLGRIDFPLNIGKNDTIEDSIFLSREGLIDSIGFYEGIFKAQKSDMLSLYTRSQGELSAENLTRSELVLKGKDTITAQGLIYPLISYPERGIYLYLTSDKFRKRFTEISTNDPNLSTRNLFKQVTSELVVGVDWLEFKVDLFISDYGKI